MDFQPLKLKIYVGPTSIYFHARKDGNLGPCNLEQFMRDNLQEYEYNPRFGRNIATYRYSLRDEVYNLAVLPRYALDKLCIFLTKYGMPFELVSGTVVSPRHAEIKLKKNVQPRENQGDIIDFLSDQNLMYHPLSAQTGSGKTVMTMIAMSRLSLVTMIVLPCLINQWYKAIRKFTTVKPDEIYVVQGFDTLQKLWKMQANGYYPKVIIFATRTLLLYATTSSAAYANIPTYNDFQRVFGIGVKVIDEVHLGFNTNVLIDLSSHIQHNLYLSATYKRTNRVGRRIFDMVFPRELIYTGATKKKYTVITLASYSIGLGGSEVAQFNTFKGYNHSKYEAYVLKLKELHDEFFDRVIPTALKVYYLDLHKEEYRALILCQTQDFAREIHDTLKHYLKENGFDRSIGLYFSGTTKQTELNRDIVVSTVKSCGTGTDLPGLICCINTISFASPVLAVQMAGRLREIPGEETKFVDLWCRDIGVHLRHKDARVQEYRNIAKRLDSVDL